MPNFAAAAALTPQNAMRNLLPQPSAKSSALTSLPPLIDSVFRQTQATSHTLPMDEDANDGLSATAADSCKDAAQDEDDDDDDDEFGLKLLSDGDGEEESNAGKNVRHTGIHFMIFYAYSWI